MELIATLPKSEYVSIEEIPHGHAFKSEAATKANNNNGYSVVVGRHTVHVFTMGDEVVIHIGHIANVCHKHKYKDLGQQPTIQVDNFPTEDIPFCNMQHLEYILSDGHMALCGHLKDSLVLRNNRHIVYLDMTSEGTFRFDSVAHIAQGYTWTSMYTSSIGKPVFTIKQ